MRKLLLVVAVAGCALETGGDVSTGEVEQALCPKFTCGGDNSPVINGVYFHDLNTSGLANKEGFALVGFIDKNGKPYTLHVERGRMFGTAGSLKISQQQLVGAQLLVMYQGVKYGIRIDEVSDDVPYWTKKSSAKLEAYKLSYFETAYPTRSRPLCSNPQAESPDNLSMTQGLAFYTLVFEGDRIDAARKLVQLDTVGGWFNLGCAGSAPAKMYLTGHAYPAAFDNLITKVEWRQTILKMFAADYCGDGTSFTVAGQPLTWADDQQWMDLLPDATTLEARWKPTGASCIGTPRASVPNTPAWDLFKLTGADQVIQACAGKKVVLDNCANQKLEPDGMHLVSVNRTP